jgi:drug/metabolite transporter (DMT)-like permease
MISTFGFQMSQLAGMATLVAHVKFEILNVNFLGMDKRDVYTWASIAMIVIGSTAGDILIARAMLHIGDMGELRRQVGTLEAAKRVLIEPRFWLGVVFMAVGYFSLVIAFSWADASLVIPASGSLTFVTNAFAARIFLHEKVDKRRWMAAVFVAGGVALLSQ